MSLVTVWPVSVPLPPFFGLGAAICGFELSPPSPGRLRGVGCGGVGSVFSRTCSRRLLAVVAVYGIPLPCRAVADTGLLGPDDFNDASPVGAVLDEPFFSGGPAISPSSGDATAWLRVLRGVLTAEKISRTGCSAFLFCGASGIDIRGAGFGGRSVGWDAGAVCFVGVGATG